MAPPRYPRAWTDEQQSVAASRDRWKLIGEALKIGRELHKSNQAFGAWCEAEGFGGMDRRDRAAALWFITHPEALSHDATTNIGHPRALQAAHRKLTAPATKPKAPVKAPTAPP